MGHNPNSSWDSVSTQIINLFEMVRGNNYGFFIYSGSPRWAKEEIDRKKICGMNISWVNGSTLKKVFNLPKSFKVAGTFIIVAVPKEWVHAYASFGNIASVQKLGLLPVFDFIDGRMWSPDGGLVLHTTTAADVVDSISMVYLTSLVSLSKDQDS